jgi:predicted anti-sigma-YlaC factor YlaD
MHYTADTLDDYLHGEIAADRDALIHAHLDGCADCRVLYEELAGVRDWIRNAAMADERDLPPMVKARVWAAVRTAPPTWQERLRGAWRPWLAVPVAAAIAGVAYLGVPGHFSAAHAGVSASYLLEEHAAGTADNPLADRGLIVPASLVEGSSGSLDADQPADDGR